MAIGITSTGAASAAAIYSCKNLGTLASAVVTASVASKAIKAKDAFRGFICLSYLIE
jgi:hypothetical protein